MHLSQQLGDMVYRATKSEYGEIFHLIRTEPSSEDGMCDIVFMLTFSCDARTKSIAPLSPFVDLSFH